MLVQGTDRWYRLTEASSTDPQAAARLVQSLASRYDKFYVGVVRK